MRILIAPSSQICRRTSTSVADCTRPAAACLVSACCLHDGSVCGRLCLPLCLQSTDVKINLLLISCRANAQQPKLFVGMILILIFAEALALYGLIGELLPRFPCYDLGLAELTLKHHHTARLPSLLLSSRIYLMLLMVSALSGSLHQTATPCYIVASI